MFLSLDSLARVRESAYKLVIDRLDRARFLIAIGTRTDYMMSRWVQYEWNSFEQEILNGCKLDGEIFPVLEGLTQSDLPYSLRHRQRFAFTENGLHALATFPIDGSRPHSA